jgi:hypothetical protein
VQDTQQRFDEVFDVLDQERRRFDRDLRRLATAAAYLGTVLVGLDPRPSGGVRRGPTIEGSRRAIRRRCGPRRR